MSILTSNVMKVGAHLDDTRAFVEAWDPALDANANVERIIDENLLAFLPRVLLDLPIPAAAVANGQLIAFSRKAYEAIGGHAAVASEIVEDLALGKAARRNGLKLGLALGGAEQFAQARQGQAPLGQHAPAAHHLLHRRKRTPEQQGGSHQDARRAFAADDEIGAQCLHQHLHRLAGGPREGGQRH